MTPPAPTVTMNLPHSTITVWEYDDADTLATLCQLLGLNPQNVQSIEMRYSATQGVRVKVEQWK